MTVYFGYGSNLWKDQMKLRCPTSLYLGVARLKGYRWLINSRGYANVVQALDKQTARPNETWGLVYTLLPDDESRLDVNEGVPEAYTKEYMQVDLWPKNGNDPPDTKTDPLKINVLVYIDRLRRVPACPRTEYIYRVNKGIQDALAERIPEVYVREVLRAFIPDHDDESVEEYAKRQALAFEDEN